MVPRRAARDELEAAIEEIRRVPGFEQFLRPASFDDIIDWAGPDPLVYLLPGVVGGTALVTRPWDRRVEPIDLPDLTEAELAARLQGYRAASESYRANARSGGPARAAWEAAIDDMTAWLWTTVMGPLIAALGDIARVTLVPVGLLGVLPLHAAWTPDGAGPSGRRYALDRLIIMYAPNARSLAAARDRWGSVVGEHLVAVDEPDLGGSPGLRLPYSVIEVGAAAAAFPDHEVLAGQAATKVAVLDALARARHVHMSCHGRADPARPLDSALAMAGGELLTLRDLLRSRLDIGLAVLSACETAIPGQDLPDEVIALPTGLIEAGAGAAIGSLWSVPGLATALLMLRFYDLWRTPGVTAASALRDAQVWVRDTKTEGKSSYLESLLPGSGHPFASRDIQRLYRAQILDPELDPTNREHSHPFHWAAFAYVGASPNATR